MSDGIVVTAHVDFGGIAEKLMEIEPKIARSLLRKALKAVGTFWVDAIKSRVPVVSGDLKNSIVAMVRTRKAKAATVGLPTGSVEVGPGYAPVSGKHGPQNPGVYGMFGEFGLHAKKYLKNPFIRPTFDSTAEQAVQVFADVLKDGFEDAAKS
jgi:HK97 gp10 family phage protein